MLSLSQVGEYLWIKKKILPLLLCRLPGLVQEWPAWRVDVRDASVGYWQGQGCPLFRFHPPWPRGLWLQCLSGLWHGKSLQLTKPLLWNSEARSMNTVILPLVMTTSLAGMMMEWVAMSEASPVILQEELGVTSTFGGWAQVRNPYWELMVSGVESRLFFNQGKLKD
jgi:hypothetical protein